MKVRKGCNAAWYEMNISSADDQVSPCCYYGGPRDKWSNELYSLDHYWNSPNIQKVRQINSGSEVKLRGGCEGCYFFGKSQAHQGEEATYFPQFSTPFTDLSPEQRANWLAAIDDYENGSIEIKSTPLRFYVNFGFGCNLSCTMCHQVPRRGELQRQVSADALLKWKPHLKAAIDLTVIGGEPFALKEAIKFIQAIINDPEMEPVQLTICTNGTLLHKHMDLLAKKRKLQLAVSLDTIGREFEEIRIGADWKQIEKNILDFQAEGKRLGYPWQVQAPCMLMKTNVPKLVDFVEWCIANSVQPGFYDFINAPGIERTHELENVVTYPHLLDDIPEWERYFIVAIDRLKHSLWAACAPQLDNLYTKIRTVREERLEDGDDAHYGPLLGVTVAKDGWLDRASILRGRLKGHSYTLTTAGVRVLFRSDMDDASQWELNRYGPTGGIEIQSGGMVALDTAARYSTGDPKDHLSSPYTAAAKDTAVVFFSVWVKPISPDDIAEFRLQDDTFRFLSSARTVITRPDGWVLLAGWAEVSPEQRVRVVLAQRSGTASLLDKALLVSWPKLN